jgi:hypothetical protein
LQSKDYLCKKYNKMLQKGIYTGLIEKDANGNYICGGYLLDYKMTLANFKVGDKITIKTVIENPSDLTYKDYPKKSKNFALFNLKP